MSRKLPPHHRFRETTRDNWTDGLPESAVSHRNDTKTSNLHRFHRVRRPPDSTGKLDPYHQRIPPTTVSEVLGIQTAATHTPELRRAWIDLNRELIQTISLTIPIIFASYQQIPIVINHTNGLQLTAPREDQSTVETEHNRRWSGPGELGREPATPPRIHHHIPPLDSFTKQSAKPPESKPATQRQRDSRIPESIFVNRKGKTKTKPPRLSVSQRV